MERIRKAYIEGDDLAEPKDRVKLLDITMVTEKTIWLLNHLLDVLQQPSSMKK